MTALWIIVCLLICVVVALAHILGGVCSILRDVCNELAKWEEEFGA